MSDLVFVVQTEIQFLALFGQLVTVGLTKQLKELQVKCFLLFAMKGVAVQEYNKSSKGIKS